MIGLEDRQALTRNIDVAHTAGARLKPACEIAVSAPSTPTYSVPPIAG